MSLKMMVCEPLTQGFYKSDFYVEIVEEQPFECLEEEQNCLLEQFKIQLLRENYGYLKEHPEIKQFINMLLTAVDFERPVGKVKHFLCDYFLENFQDIQKMLKPLSQSEHSSVCSFIRKSLLEKLKAKHGCRKTEDSKSSGYKTLISPWVIEKMKQKYLPAKSEKPSKAKKDSIKAEEPKLPQRPVRLVEGDFGFYGRFSKRYHPSVQKMRKDESNLNGTNENKKVDINKNALEYSKENDNENDNENLNKNNVTPHWAEETKDFFDSNDLDFSYDIVV